MISWGYKMIDPLNTDKCVTKKDLVDWLKVSDSPDDSELWLWYDDEEGRFKVSLKWEFLAGAYMDDMIKFSKAESDFVLKDIDKRK